LIYGFSVQSGVLVKIVISTTRDPYQSLVILQITTQQEKRSPPES